jgi:dynein heavy chain
MGSKNSFNIFLKHELNQMQKLLNIVRTSLSNLKLAIEGVVSLNEVHKLLNDETK